MNENICSAACYLYNIHKKINSNTFFGGDRIPYMKASHNKLHIKQTMSLGNTKHKKSIPIINMQQRIAFAQDPRFTKS